MTAALTVVLIILIAILVLKEIQTMSHHKHPHHCDCDICKELRELRAKVDRILRILEAPHSTLPTDMVITQIEGDSQMATNNSIAVGSSGTFQETNIPGGSVYPAGTVIAWAASDPLVTFTASPDGDTSKIVANVPVGDTATTFQLGVQATGTDSNGNPFTVTGSAPITVTITGGVTPPANLPTDMSITQLS
jgi:hypothetical protein